MKKILITENQLNYIVNNIDNIMKEYKRPLQKLLSCKITSDGKYIVYEDKAYYTSTGEKVLINEEWTLSDTLHTAADVASIGLDFVIPGSGAVVDVLNAISYIIEAQFKPEEEKDSLYLMAAISLAFVIIPGPLQAIAGPLKNAIKTGKGMTSKIVVKGLEIIASSMDLIFKSLPNLIQKALKSPLAKTIIGKYGDKISNFISKFTSRATTLFSKILKKPDLLGKVGGKEVAKLGSKESGKEVAKLGSKQLTLIGGKATKEELGLILSLNNKLLISPITKVSGISKLMKNIGIVPSKTYGKKTITKISDDFVEYVVVGSKITKKISTWQFIKTFILKPSAKLNTKFVPAIVKAIMRCVRPDGTINNEELDKIKIDPIQTEKDLEYLSTLVAEYEGDTKKYTVNNNVKNAQDALLLLGYKLPKFGADGKFGPETRTTIKQFQEENDLTTSLGKLDRYTTLKLSELLKSKGVANSEELQQKLENM